MGSSFLRWLCFCRRPGASLRRTSTGCRSSRSSVQLICSGSSRSIPRATSLEVWHCLLPFTSPASAAAAMCLSAAETLPSLAVQATLQREGASQTGGGWRRRSRLTKSGASATARCGGWRGPWSRAGHRWCTRTVSEPLSRRHASRVRAHTPRNGFGEALSCCHDDVTMPLAAPIRLQGKAGLLLL